MKMLAALLTAVAVAATVVTATATADALFLGEATKHPAKVTVPD